MPTYKQGEWLLFTSEVAILLGVNDSRVRQMIYEGRIPSFQQNYKRDHVIKPDDLYGLRLYRHGRPREHETEAARTRLLVLNFNQETTIPCPDCGNPVSVESIVERMTARCEKCEADRRVMGDTSMSPRIGGGRSRGPIVIGVPKRGDEHLANIGD